MATTYNEIEITDGTTLGVLPPGTQILIECGTDDKKLAVPYWSDKAFDRKPVAGQNVQDEPLAWIGCRIRIPVPGGQAVGGAVGHKSGIERADFR